MRCEFRATKLEYLIDDLAAGHFDIAAVGLLITPERSQKVLFSRPVYRSVAVWIAKPGVEPGRRACAFPCSRVRYTSAMRVPGNREVVAAENESQMIEQLSAGVARAAVSPLMTSIGLQRNPLFIRLGLKGKLMQVPELEGNACFAINPRRADLKESLDKALEKIKRNGIYDRINTEFLPFKVE